MPFRAGRNEHSVPRHRTIINHSSARKGRQCAARFVPQKISRCKVPVVAIAAGKSHVAGGMRDLGEAERQRAHPRHGGEGRRHSGKPLKQAARSGDSRAVQRRTSGHFDWRAIAGGARRGARGKELFADRRIETGDGRPTIFDQRRRHRPIGKTGDVSAGAVDRIDIVGIYPNYTSAYAAWKAKAQGSVDNAQMRYFIVHLHRLLDPDSQPPQR